ncbi:multiubiquitin domain-containing protein [Pseudomonas ogarae]|uniref:multiubiquitin domain-containing protein n=1 Tax=Pseudomonas ogarae (strain DSM 112162 / CECT 30235 / F113) TaxID=1114970 RepID=UPI00164910BC|nr:multiubiquitin domain-containing protein [Pseudomonas zarinae]QXH95736.1 multiubiquitin domain-containing protein [Pseudomonas zarinae]
MTQLNDLDVEDVSAAVLAGREVREHGPYKIQVGNEGLEYQSLVISDPVPTGQQILEVAGLRPMDEHLLFQMYANGHLELLSPSETTDLRQAGVEKFLAFKSDRSFRFFIDGRSHDWGGQRISGRTLKQLAGVDAHKHEVYLVIPGKDDELIEDHDLFDLTRPGVEHFAAVEINIKVFVNTLPTYVHSRYLSYWEVVRLAYPDAVPAPNAQFTVTYAKGFEGNSLTNLVDGQIVRIKKGMHFNVTPTDKS